MLLYSVLTQIFPKTGQNLRELDLWTDRTAQLSRHSFDDDCSHCGRQSHWPQCTTAVLITITTGFLDTAQIILTSGPGLNTEKLILYI